MDKTDIFTSFETWLKTFEEREEELALEDSERENKYYNPDMDDGRDFMEIYNA